MYIDTINGDVLIIIYTLTKLAQHSRMCWV